MLRNFSIINKLVIIFCLSLFIACQSDQPEVSEIPKTNEVEQSSPILTPSSIQAVSPISPIVPTYAPSPEIPTPTANTGSVYGLLVEPDTQAPAIGIPIFLGTFDGTFMEISLNNSPSTYTDENGYFVLTNVPPNDDAFQYVVGIIISDRGTILTKFGEDNELIFDVEAGKVINLGILENNF